MRKQVQQLVTKHNLERCASQIEGYLRPAIHITKSNANDLVVGASRFGGLPDVPPDFSWVCWQDKPLSFLAQINCAEIQAYNLEHILPDSGMLYFFYDAIEQPWGFDPSDRGSSAVIYIPNGEALAPAILPKGEDMYEVCCNSFGLEFSIVPSLPAGDTIAGEQMGLTSEELENYSELLGDLQQIFTPNTPLHQLLGYPCNIQNDMQLECQLVSHGLYCGDLSGYTDPRAKALEAGTSEWRLLFQFDSDDDLGLMWGDLGMIYFWLRESSFRQKRFDEAWTILQCS